MKEHTERFIRVHKLFDIMDKAQEIVREYGSITRLDIYDLYNQYLYGHEFITTTFKDNKFGFTNLDNMKLIIAGKTAGTPGRYYPGDAVCHVEFPWSEMIEL